MSMCLKYGDLVEPRIRVLSKAFRLFNPGTRREIVVNDTLFLTLYGKGQLLYQLGHLDRKIPAFLFYYGKMKVLVTDTDASRVKVLVVCVPDDIARLEKKGKTPLKGYAFSVAKKDAPQFFLSETETPLRLEETGTTSELIEDATRTPYRFRMDSLEPERSGTSFRKKKKRRKPWM